MNGTHRGLNRTLLAMMGLVLIGAGAAAVLAGSNTGFARNWTATGTQAWARIQENLAAARIPGMDTSWWTLAALVMLLLIAVLLVGWIASQGTGRTNQLAEQTDAKGNTSVDAAVAAQVIEASLARNTQVLSTSVQSWKIRGSAGGTGLKIIVQARKGASPAEVGTAVGHAVDGMDELLGTQLPVLVRIKAGTRTRFARSERVS